MQSAQLSELSPHTQAAAFLFLQEPSLRKAAPRGGAGSRDVLSRRSGPNWPASRNERVTAIGAGHFSHAQLAKANCPRISRLLTGLMIAGQGAGFPGLCTMLKW